MTHLKLRSFTRDKRYTSKFCHKLILLVIFGGKSTTTSMHLCFLFMMIFKNLYCFQTWTCSPDNLDHTENAASGSGPPARGRSAVTRRHKFDLAARTLLARAGNYVSHPVLCESTTTCLYFKVSVKAILKKI